MSYANWPVLGFKSITLISSVALVLTACGGGSGGDDSPTLSGANNPTGSNPASQQNSNSQSATLYPANAPLKTLENDITDLFDWTDAVGFSAKSDYQYSVDNGVTWQEVTERPIVIGDINLAKGYVQVRVKAVAGKHKASLALKSERAYSKLDTPSKPQIGVQDDRLDTFAWKNVKGYHQPSDYEYSLDQGASWLAINNKPLEVGDKNIPIGNLWLRIKEVKGRNKASEVLKNTQKYTKAPEAQIALNYLKADGSLAERIDDASCVQFVSQSKMGSQTVLATVLSNKIVKTKVPYSANVAIYKDENIALNKTVTTSSTENGSSFVPAKAVDGNKANPSRWASTSDSATAWLKVDLGQAYDIKQVNVFWETAKAKKYLVEISTDDSNWQTVATETDNADANKQHSFASQSARYIRINGQQRIADGVTNKWGYSIFEVEVIASVQDIAISQFCNLPASDFVVPNKAELSYLFGSQLDNLLVAKSDAGYWYCDDTDCNNSANAYALNKDNTDADVSQKHYQRYVFANSQHTRDKGQNYWLNMLKKPQVQWQKSTPDAPTGVSLNTTERTLLFVKSSGYDELFDYEYTVDGGHTWQFVGTNPIVLPTQALTSGQIKVRVAETQINFPSKAVSPNQGLSEKLPAPPSKYKLVGNELQKLADDATDFECIKDEALGVFWNKGSSISENVKIVHHTDYTSASTVTRVDTVNAAKPCGQILWQLPTYAQIKSLLPQHGGQNPSGRNLWASAPFADLQYDRNYLIKKTGGGLYEWRAWIEQNKINGIWDNNPHYIDGYYVFVSEMAADVYPNGLFNLISGYQAQIKHTFSKMQNWQPSASLMLVTYEQKLQDIKAGYYSKPEAIIVRNQLLKDIDALSAKDAAWSAFNTRITQMNNDLASKDPRIAASLNFTSAQKQDWSNRYVAYQTKRDALIAKLEPTGEKTLAQIKTRMQAILAEVKTQIKTLYP